jgi:hypothetical protein
LVKDTSDAALKNIYRTTEIPGFKKVTCALYVSTQSRRSLHVQFVRLMFDLGGPMNFQFVILTSRTDLSNPKSWDNHQSYLY